ncbi:MAG: hypothetical protein WCL25_04495, partial [bacterium]
RFLAMLNNKPLSTAEEFGINAVRTYRDYFLAGGDTEATKLTQSAVRLTKMNGLRIKLDAWVALAVKAAEKNVLFSARKNCKVFDDAGTGGPRKVI